jgi:hypothetical protein
MYNEMTDSRALVLLNEFAKVDPEALKLMAMLQDSRDWGDREMLIGKMHRYIEDKVNSDV